MDQINWPSFTALFIATLSGGWALFTYFDKRIVEDNTKIKNDLQNQINKNSEDKEKNLDKLKAELAHRIDKLESENKDKFLNYIKISEENKDNLSKLLQSLNDLRSELQTKYVEKTSFQNEIKEIKAEISKVLDRQNDNRKEIESRLEKLIGILLDLQKG